MAVVSDVASGHPQDMVGDAGHSERRPVWQTGVWGLCGDDESITVGGGQPGMSPQDEDQTGMGMSHYTTGSVDTEVHVSPRKHFGRYFLLLCLGELKQDETYINV